MTKLCDEMLCLLSHEGVVVEETTELNMRQQIGLRIGREKGSISTGEYRAATGAPERTALRELRELVDRGIIASRGKTRGLRYFLA